MSGSQWRDARVRAAEESLADAVRTADEIIADAVADRADEDKQPIEPIDEQPPPPILHDAW
jgi:hypothetical protein